jgi:hypothetical protein
MRRCLTTSHIAAGAGLPFSATNAARGTLPGEREAVISADRLIMGSIDRKTETVTEQKSPDGAVADKQHIARAIASQDIFDLADHAQWASMARSHPRMLSKICPTGKSRGFLIFLSSPLAKNFSLRR